MAISRKVTMQQIADAAGVSIATASRAINNPASVRETTRLRIQQAMKDLDCQPKTAAGKMILASFPIRSHQFFDKCIAGMDAASRQRGYNLYVLRISDFMSPQSYEPLTGSHPFCGMIFSHALPSGEETVTRLSAGVPVVMCSGAADCSRYPFSYVTFDNRVASLNAMNYLIASGRRKIAMVNNPATSNTIYAIDREKGYTEALGNAGIPVRPEWLIHIPVDDFDTAYSAVLPLLSGNDPPDAFFCVADIMAAAVIRAAHDTGKRVPEDLAVMGFDNLDLSSMITPALSTVDLPGYKMGYQSCNMLIDMIEGNPVSNPKVVLNADIVIRRST